MSQVKIEWVSVGTRGELITGEGPSEIITANTTVQANSTTATTYVARVMALDTAAYVLAGTNPITTSTNSVLAKPGVPVLLSIQPGQKLAVLQAQGAEAGLGSGSEVTVSGNVTVNPVYISGGSVGTTFAGNVTCNPIQIAAGQSVGITGNVVASPINIAAGQSVGIIGNVVASPINIAAGQSVGITGNVSVNPVTITGGANPTSATPFLANNLSTTVVTVNGTASTLVSYYIFNPSAATAYVQIFDAATATTVTLGTTVPKWSVGIPAGGGANISGLALSFANGIKVAATTTATGSTAPATALDANFGYR